jgi:hypothetical protein
MQERHAPLFVTHRPVTMIRAVGALRPREAAGDAQPQPQLGVLRGAWLPRARVGAQLLLDTHRIRRTPICEERASLVALIEPSTEFGVVGKRAVFVQWLHPTDRVGRIVHVNAKGDAVYSVGWHHRVQGFDTATIVHPEVDIDVRVKGSRSRVTEPISRLQRMADIAHACDPTAFDPCIVCNVNDEHCRVCCLCLCCFHATCTNSLNVADLGSDATPPRGFSRTTLPDRFHTQLCNMCAVWAR